MLWSHTGVLSILEASLIGLLEEEDRQKGSLCPTRNAHIPRLLRLSASLPSFCLPTCVLLFLDSDLVQDLFPGPAAASTYHQPPPLPTSSSMLPDLFLCNHLFAGYDCLAVPLPATHFSGPPCPLSALPGPLIFSSYLRYLQPLSLLSAKGSPGLLCVHNL